MRQALDDDYLPVWLQAAGYRTMHVGKFLNAMDPTDTRFRFAYAHPPIVLYCCRLHGGNVQSVLL